MRRALDAIALLTLAALAAATVAAFVETPWPVVLVQSFRPHLFIVAALLAGALALGRRFGLAVGAGAIGAINYLAMALSPFAEPNAPRSGPELTAVWANVHGDPDALAATLDFARARGADLILLGEFPLSLDVGDDFAPDYAHRVDSTGGPPPTRWTDRMVALSRAPLSNVEIVHPDGDTSRVFLKLTIDVGGATPLNVVAVHPNAPLNATWYARNARYLELVGEAAEPPFVLIGDFNATPWSTAYRRLPGRRLGDPKWSITWKPWPDHWAPDFLIGLPIDHVFVSDGVGASAFEIGPAVAGSDHRPIAATLHPPR